ncbi:MAG: DNA repair protein RadA [Lachnospiraceae bacterium]|nr:DNA repair protein RadA [Lachnospiraceae bacterium]
MAKSKSVYICSECGYESPKWYGKCPTCGEWNTMNEEIVAPKEREVVQKVRTASVSSRPMKLLEIDTKDECRYKTGIGELDNVLGGGIVKGSLVLIGGDPGIGKSTILLQVCQNLGSQINILYVSGEESRRQLKLRADRLGVTSEMLVMTETDVEIIAEQIKAEEPDLVIIDSIQTMNLTQLNSSPGSVTQVRECTNLLMRTAKMLEIPMVIVGHVNKDGAIAGPKVLEHIVDAVLYFEGDRQLSYRVLRAVKNRFGSTNEIGVFEMRSDGLKEVENPSVMLLSGRPTNASGTCVACTMEGSRPILAEVQALATNSGYGTPRRMSTGFDYNRMALLIAVLEKKAGFYFSGADAYVNVVGGFRLDERAVDLCVAAALVSSLKDFQIPEDVLVFGEIGLAGEIRSVAHAEKRINEAARMGFRRCILPYYNYRNLAKGINPDIELVGVRSVRQAIKMLME